MSEGMKRSALAKSETQFLSVVALLVVLLGVPVVTSIGPSSTHDQVVVRSHNLEDQLRAPASESQNVEPAAGGLKKTPGRTNNLITLKCGVATTTHQVQSAHVRLQGGLCHNAKALKVTNLTNGFSASIIMTGPNEFSTDFIDLQEGENELQVVHLNGTKEVLSTKVQLHLRHPANVDQKL